MQLFYLENKDSDTIHLSAEESKHLSRVLRKTVGDSVYFTDGTGHRVIAKLTDDNHHACILQVQERIKVEKPVAGLHLLISPTKQAERIEWCLEKCTEIGLTKFTPLLSARSERSRLKTDRLKKIAISAMKQSGQYYLPEIGEATEFSSFVKELAPLAVQKYIAHCEDDFKRDFSEALLPGDAIILIGPEGDFSPQEIELAKSSGFVPVSLGPNRLRTETAGMFACASFQLNRK
jgi:16S rRNA (uracil1498-N3)-methyltransferase